MLQEKKKKRGGKGEVRRGTHFYRLEPARLLHLVVDDRLVLVDALVARSGEDHILIKRWGKKDELVIRRWLRRLRADLQSGKKSLTATSKHCGIDLHVFHKIESRGAGGVNVEEWPFKDGFALCMSTCLLAANLVTAVWK